MRQVMPHRNNMSLHRNKCKTNLLCGGVIVGAVTKLQQVLWSTYSMRENIRMRNNGLHVCHFPIAAPPPISRNS